MQSRSLGFVFGLAILLAGLILVQQGLFSSRMLEQQASAPGRPEQPSPVSLTSATVPVSNQEPAGNPAGSAGTTTTQQDPAAADPAAVDPSTIDPSTIDPSTIDPSTIDPSTIDPKVTDPAATDPAATDPEVTAKQDQPAPAGDPASAAGASQEAAAGDPAPAVAPAAQPASPEKFYTLGSLAPNGEDRYLVTFTSIGGSIRRVELNDRDARGNYRYRDLEHFGGFVGNLELQKDAGGLRIRTVGAQTPAAIAGLQVDDLIVAVDGEPVISAGEFEAMLAGRKVGEDLRIAVLRKAGEESSARTEVTVRLTEQPLELIRPDDYAETPGLRSPPSFVLALYKPDSNMSWQLVDPAMGRGNWEAESRQFDGQPGIEFSREVEPGLVKAAGLTGSLRVVKRYWLQKPGAGDSGGNDQSFHINFEMEIISDSAEPQELAWELDGPTGLSTEGWWYQNKIHGRASAIGSTAGARDVVGSTSVSDYVFWGAPEIISNANRTAPAFQWLVETAEAGKSEPPVVRYLGVDSQYFNVALIPATVPTNSEPEYRVHNAFAAVASAELPKAAKYNRIVDCTFVLFDRAMISAGQSYRQQFRIFAGPKEKQLLESYGLENNRTFGWFAWLSKFLCWLLGVFYWMTGSFSYGLAIILLTVLVRLLMIPISHKAAINAQMMQLLAPEMKAIADRYKDDMDKRARAQRELFQKHKYNPFGGCFLLFLQLPVFIGLYRGLSVDIALRDKPLIPGMSWCSNLAGPDQLAYWKESMPSWLGSETGWLGPWFNVLPLVTIVLFLVQQKLFTPPPTDDQQKFMQRMMTWMMVFMGVMFFKVPSGLCIYFITSSLWGIAERQLLPKPKLSEEKIESIKATLGSSGTGAGAALVAQTPAEPKPAAERPSMARDLMKRLRDQIEYGEQRPVQKPMDAETKKRLDKERAKRRRDPE